MYVCIYIYTQTIHVSPSINASIILNLSVKSQGNSSDCIRSNYIYIIYI